MCRNRVKLSEKQHSSFNLKDEQDLGRRQIGGRAPGREGKRGQKKASLVCQKDGARSGGACLHVNVGTEDVKCNSRVGDL